MQHFIYSILYFCSKAFLFNVNLKQGFMHHLSWYCNLINISISKCYTVFLMSVAIPKSYVDLF